MNHAAFAKLQEKLCRELSLCETNVDANALNAIVSLLPTDIINITRSIVLILTVYWSAPGNASANGTQSAVEKTLPFVKRSTGAASKAWLGFAHKKNRPKWFPCRYCRNLLCVTC